MKDIERYTRAIAMIARQCQMLERRDALLLRFLAAEESMDFLCYAEGLAADVRKELGRENKG